MMMWGETNATGLNMDELLWRSLAKAATAPTGQLELWRTAQFRGFGCLDVLVGGSSLPFSDVTVSALCVQ